MISMVAIVRLSLPLTIVVSVSVVPDMAVSVVAISMVAIVTIARLSLPLTVVEPVSVVSEMAVSVMGITKVTVSMDESVVSVVSVVSVRRGFCLGFSLAEDCSHQEESEEHNGLHICGCEQARDPS